jgi:hypothetical protein
MERNGEWATAVKRCGRPVGAMPELGPRRSSPSNRTEVSDSYDLHPRTSGSSYLPL